MSNLILIAGGAGQGKSFLVNETLLKNNIQKDSAGKDFYTLSPQSKNQYIFDLNNEYRLPDDNILRPQMRHTRCDEIFFIETCRKLRNTNIVFEDATGFLRGRQKKEIAQLIVQRRHAKNNYIILFHSIIRIPPELMEYANYFILLKTGDNIRAIEQKFDNPEIIKMFQIVSASKKRISIQKKLL